MTAPDATGPAPAAACLRIFNSAGEEYGLRCLHGMPASLGITEGDSGRYAVVELSATEERLIAVTSGSAEWWDQLIDQAQKARDELVYGGGRLTLAQNGVAR